MAYTQPSGDMSNLRIATLGTDVPWTSARQAYLTPVPVALVWVPITRMVPLPGPFTLTAGNTQRQAWKDLVVLVLAKMAR